MPPEAPAAASAPVSAPATTETPGAQGAAAPDAGAAGGKAPPAAAAKPKTWDLKINGKTQRFTEEQMIARVSQEEAADQRFKEASQMRKQTESVIGRLKDPTKVMEALLDPSMGLTKDQVREAFEGWYAREFIEPESLTPEQKKLRDAEAKIKKYEDDDRSRSEKKLKEEQEAMTTQERTALQGEIIEALQTSDLPKTNFTIRRLAYWMQRNRENGFNAPKEVLVGQVRKEFNSNLRDMVQASDGEVLIKLFEGTDIINKLRKYDLEQLRKLRQGPPAPAGNQDGTPPPAKSDRPPTSAEVNQRIRQLQKTGRY